MRLPPLVLALLPLLLLLLLGPVAAYDMQWQTGRATHYGGENSRLAAIRHHVGAAAESDPVGRND